MSFTLLILAGGLGSRFNGKKQLHGLGPNNELLMEYSIYDALKSGCSKIVILSNQECISILETRLSYLHSKIELIFVDQFTYDPNYPKYRKRPWGTAHAVFSCAEFINKPFLVINADDFYGGDSYKKAQKLIEITKGTQHAMIGFKLGNTLSEFGGVSRGLCDTSNKTLVSIIELTNIQIKNNEITCSQNTDGLNNNLLVSMNLWVFNPLIFPLLRDAFETFYSENKKDENAELYLPYVINQLIQNGEISVTIADTDSSWFGLTFAKDLTPSVKKLKSLISQGLYPFKLTTDG